MSRKVANEMMRELQLRLLATPTSCTFKEWLRFKMFTLESKYIPMKEDSIFGNVRVVVNDKVTSPVHLKIFKDYVDLDMSLLIGKIKREGINCTLEEILESKVITEQHISKICRLHTVATFAVVLEICSNSIDS